MDVITFTMRRVGGRPETRQKKDVMVERNSIERKHLESMP